MDSPSSPQISIGITQVKDVESGEQKQEEQGRGHGYGTTDMSVSVKSNTSTLTGENDDDRNESTALLGQQQRQQQEEENYYTTNDYRYLTSSDEENRRKCMNGLTPVLLFLFLMGMVSFALFKNFDRLYPGHGTYDDSSGSFANSARNHYDHKSYTIDNKNEDGNDATQFNKETANYNDNASDNSSDNSGDKFKVGVINLSDCSLNHKCNLLGLTGQCCPTPSGVKLECCDN